MIRGTHISLRAVEENDFQKFEEIESKKELFLSSCISSTPNSPNETLAILSNDDQQLIGFVGIHHIDYQNHHGEMGLTIALDIHDSSILEVLKLFCDYAFIDMKLNRLYGYTLHSLDAYGFKQEAILRQAHFVEENFKDLYLVALLRSDWK